MLGQVPLLVLGVAAVLAGQLVLDEVPVGHLAGHGLGLVHGVELAAQAATVLQQQVHAHVALQDALLGHGDDLLAGGLPVVGHLLHHGAVGGEVHAVELGLVVHAVLLHAHGDVGVADAHGAVLEQEGAVPGVAGGAGVLEVVDDVLGVLGEHAVAVHEGGGQDVLGEGQGAALHHAQVDGLLALEGVADALAGDHELVAVHAALHAVLHGHLLGQAVLGLGHIFNNFAQRLQDEG